jgi:hypothetical protein
MPTFTSYGETMSKDIEGKHSTNEPRKKRVFKNFADYWHYVKHLSEEQLQTLASALSKSEQKFLKASYEKGGWEDLFMRNQCDKVLDYIKETYGVDLLLIRSKVLSGKDQLIQKSFWIYIKSRFEKVTWHHISYIFDGIMDEPSDDPDYLRLKKYEAKAIDDTEEADSDSE